MGDYYLGQIMMTGFNFAPRGWAQCNGQLVAVNQNQALFSLFGTQYGGDGRTTFGLPDLRGRTPVGFSPSANPPMQIGQNGGSETVTLLSNQLPLHGHQVVGVTTPGDNRNPSSRTFASTNGGVQFYAAQAGAPVAQAPGSVATAGSNAPHPNMQPYTTLNFCVALTGGIYPTRQ